MSLSLCHSWRAAALAAGTHHLARRDVAEVNTAQRAVVPLRSCMIHCSAPPSLAIHFRWCPHVWTCAPWARRCANEEQAPGGPRGLVTSWFSASDHSLNSRFSQSSIFSSAGIAPAPSASASQYVDNSIAFIAQTRCRCCAIVFTTNAAEATSLRQSRSDSKVPFIHSFIHPRIPLRGASPLGTSKAVGRVFVGQWRRRKRRFLGQKSPPGGLVFSAQLSGRIGFAASRTLSWKRGCCSSA